jgi:hypothetical protein
MILDRVNDCERERYQTNEGADPGCKESQQMEISSDIAQQFRDTLELDPTVWRVNLVGEILGPSTTPLKSDSPEMPCVTFPCRTRIVKWGTTSPELQR